MRRIVALMAVVLALGLVAPTASALPFGETAGWWGFFERIWSFLGSQLEKIGGHMDPDGLANLLAAPDNREALSQQ